MDLYIFFVVVFATPKWIKKKTSQFGYFFARCWREIPSQWCHASDSPKKNKHPYAPGTNSGQNFFFADDHTFSCCCRNSCGCCVIWTMRCCSAWNGGLHCGDLPSRQKLDMIILIPKEPKTTREKRTKWRSIQMNLLILIKQSFLAKPNLTLFSVSWPNLVELN